MKMSLNSHLGSNPDPCYIQNCVIMNHVIKRFRCKNDKCQSASWAQGTSERYQGKQ